MDKLEKVRKEIERLKKNWQLGRSSEAKYRVEMLEEISYLIDSVKEESVSEELEDAANEYCVGSSYSEAIMEKPAFKAGAKWQRQKDEHLIWQTSTANYEKGIEEGKQQMMKDAVECYIGANKEMTHKLLCFSPREQKIALDDALSEIRIGDKVHVIIIKDE